MSGHAGFQPIGNNLPPPVLPPPVAGAGEGSSSAGPGGAEAAQPPPEAPRPDAKSLAGKLDAMLLKAAELSTKAVDSKKLSKAVEGVGLSVGELSDLSDLADAAAASFAKLGAFTGRQIAAALAVGKKGAFDWKKEDPVASAIRQALDDQAALSEKLHDLANDRRVSGAAFEAVCDQAFVADRRQSEIFSLAVQLADAAERAGEDAGLDARLDAKLADLLPRQALSMHGNEAAVERLKEKLQPLADRIEAFKAKPGASIGEEEFAAYTLEVVEAENALERGRTEGFPTGDGGRWEPDRALLGAAKALAGAAKKVLLDARKEIGMRAVDDFVRQAFKVSDAYVPAYRENLDGIRGACPHLARAAALRHRLHDLAEEYVDARDPKVLQAMYQIAEKLSFVGEQAVVQEIKALRKAAAAEFDMSDAEWKAFEAEFAHLQGAASQVAHLDAMLKKVDPDGLKSAEFLTSDSARLLLEGKLSFPSLVEARIHGMDDADVDPALDDSRLAGTRPLGSGAANTVYLVKYEDGKEYVFKPEAPGRQGMASLSLSKDYKPHQTVSNLNVATQKTADALGLGDVMPRTTAGSHRGRFGLFMEKAPGAEAARFAEGGGKPAPGHLTAAQVRGLSDADHAKVVGELLRKTNRIEWFDLVTGQGDRHGKNYMVDVGPDLEVTVKCIDNDQCFPAYRTGARTYLLEGSHADRFRRRLEELVRKYPPEFQDEARERFKKDPGIRTLGNGGVRIDATKFEHPELHWALQRSVGLHGAVLPDFIDAELYERFQALKAGPARDEWIAGLRTRLPDEAVASAVARLDEAIAHAEALERAGKVVRTEDFADRNVQKRLLAPALQAPKNPIKPIANGAYRLSDAEVLEKVRRQTQPLFVRDLLKGVCKSGWLA